MVNELQEKSLWAGKRLELIETAGALFAELGMEGTSIRDIADRCKVNIASISYYFGSKENLYIEALKYVAWQVRCPLARKLINDLSTDFKSLSSRIKIIADLICERVQNYLSDKYPNWYSKLLLRSLIEPPANLEKVIFHTFIPELNDLVEVIHRCAPDLDIETCKFWAFSILGEISFYVFAEPGIKIAMNMGNGKYEGEFLKKLENHITQLILRGLQLIKD